MVKASVLIALTLGLLCVGMYRYEESVAAEARVTRPLGWMLDPQTRVSPESRRIDVLFIYPTGCGTPSTLSTKVEYRPTEVALGLALNYEANCLMAGGRDRAHFDLAEPVGDRRIVPLDAPNLTPEDFLPPRPPTIDPAFLKDPRL